MTTTNLLKCHPRSPCNVGKGKNTTLGCQSQYLPVLECLFVLGGGCRELTKEKQNSSVSKHKLKMISFSAALVSTAHKSRAALGSGSVYGPAEP